MLLSILRSGSFSLDSILQVVFLIPIILFSLSFHESAHAFVAYKLGDPTAKSLGRLTLNPFKHIDLFGALSMLLVGIGWAKPVPINSNYFKDKKLDMAISSLAGPLSNLILAFISEFLSFLFAAFYIKTGNFILLILYVVFMYSARMNVFLAVFNLIPFPPFDGSRLLLVFLPEDKYFAIMKYEDKIKIALLLLIVLGVFDVPLNAVTNGIINVFDKIIGLLPLL